MQAESKAMTLHRAILLLAGTAALTACGLKAPLLLPATGAATATQAPGNPAPTDTPLCAGGTANASVQGVCQ